MRQWNSLVTSITGHLLPINAEPSPNNRTRSHGLVSTNVEPLTWSGRCSRTRTETMLDLMEMKPPEVYDVLLEAISECYPHVYLHLTGQDSDDDDEVDDCESNS